MSRKIIPWEKAVSLLVSEPLKLNELDNDRATLERERTTFERLLAKLNPEIAIVSIQEDDKGREDMFILNRVSMRYLETIRELFKENAVQYQVEDGLYPVPIDGGPSNYKPLQQTVVIYRKALKKLKRSPSLTLFYSALCVIVLAYLLLLFYRIELA